VGHRSDAARRLKLRCTSGELLLKRCVSAITMSLRAQRRSMPCLHFFLRGTSMALNVGHENFAAM